MTLTAILMCVLTLIFELMWMRLSGRKCADNVDMRLSHAEMVNGLAVSKR